MRLTPLWFAPVIRSIYLVLLGIQLTYGATVLQLQTLLLQLLELIF